jgi:hypothetical protein
MEGKAETFDKELVDPRTEDRIRKHTATHVNDKIDRLTRARLQEHLAGGRDAVVARLKELDREWHVDRALMANFAIVGGLSHELGMHYHRGWMTFFRAQMGFLLMHALVGWCPPLPVFRRLGFRTAKEIAAERAELTRALNGHSG